MKKEKKEKSESQAELLSKEILASMDSAYEELLTTDVGADEDVPASEKTEDTSFGDGLDDITDVDSAAEEKEQIVSDEIPVDPVPADSSETEKLSDKVSHSNVENSAKTVPVIPDIMDTIPVIDEDEPASDVPADSETSDEPSEMSHVEQPEEPKPSAQKTSGEADEEDDEDEEPDSDAPGEPSRERDDDGETYQKLGLYLHIPFCKSKCAYCDFFSTDKIVCRGRHAPAEMKDYVEALKNQMKFFSERTTQYNIDTVFIGGGTPTALSPALLLDVVREVERDFYMEDGYEFTVEMNPATADLSMLKKLRRAGVNRLSIGLQSAHDHELAVLSRVHNVGDFAECFQMAREAGFTNINIDVMYGIPEQTAQSFLETLEFVCNMKPEHISMYNLRIEDGTPFGDKRHMLPLPDEDTECAMYFDGIEYLAKNGYKQYEISNFAKSGFECRHNLRYWRGEEYIGCGPAAHSYFGGRRFSFKHALAAYTQSLSEIPKSLPTVLLDENYVIDRREELAEYLMLRLRLTEGISVNDFSARFGADFERHFAPKLKTYLDNGFMVKHTTDDDVRYAFTPKGMFVSNYILARIIPFEPKYSHSASVISGSSVN